MATVICARVNVVEPTPARRHPWRPLFFTLVLTFYLSEGHSCHQTILSSLFMAAEILAVRCSCVAVPYTCCVSLVELAAVRVWCRYPQGRLAIHMEYCPKSQCHMGIYLKGTACSHGTHAFTDCSTVSYHFRIWLEGQRQDNLL